tara:strand:+ start:566 stop:1753 length:1188 start_codon:yes stop_codon:yes gene_type:complete
MRARQLIIETLLKEASDEAKFIATALDDVFDDLESDIKAQKDELSPQQNEAVGFAIAGAVVSLPALLKLIGKAIAKIQSKIKGEEVDTNTIIEVAEKLHGMLIGGVEKVLIHVFRMKDKKAAHRLAVIIFHAIVAGLLIASGAAGFKALQKSNWTAGFLEGLLTAIKSGEMSAFLGAELGQVAKALGMGAELADAADLADVLEVGEFEGLDELSSMAGGSVQGYSLPLGAKPKKDLEENQMNKLKLSKGRLREIIAEEVARHKKVTEGMYDGTDDAEVEGAEAKELAAQEPARAEDPFYEGRDEEEWDEHDVGAAEDDWSQIHKLEKDARYDARRRRGLREKVRGALEELLSADPIAEGAEERVAKFNKGPSTEDRREKLKKIAAANKAKKEKDK